MVENNVRYTGLFRKYVTQIFTKITPARPPVTPRNARSCDPPALRNTGGLEPTSIPLIY